MRCTVAHFYAPPYSGSILDSKKSSLNWSEYGQCRTEKLRKMQLSATSEATGVASPRSCFVDSRNTYKTTSCPLDTRCQGRLLYTYGWVDSKCARECEISLDGCTCWMWLVSEQLAVVRFLSLPSSKWKKHALFHSGSRFDIFVAPILRREGQAQQTIQRTWGAALVAREAPGSENSCVQAAYMRMALEGHGIYNTFSLSAMFTKSSPSLADLNWNLRQIWIQIWGGFERYSVSSGKIDHYDTQMLAQKWRLFFCAN